MATNVETGLSVISEDRISDRKFQELDDCESVYNHKCRSAYGGVKKKSHPLQDKVFPGGPRREGRYISMHAASKSNLSEFTQRIMSAKLLRVKQIQNQLTETQIQLNEVLNENRILKNLQKRQEGALKKYEGNHAELPQLIRSHNEEIRILKSNNKALKSQLRDMNGKLKEKDNELELLKDNYNKLKKLSGEKNLLDREKLQKKMEELQEANKEQEEKIQILSRKILLESKNSRHHLNLEASKHRETQKELNSALSLVNRYEGQLLAREKLGVQPGVKPGVQKRGGRGGIMPPIAKTTEKNQRLHSVESEEAFQDDFESTDSESDLLNGLMSTDETPSPTQDIFPDINPQKKKSPNLKKTTEIENSKLDMFQFDIEKPRTGSRKSNKLTEAELKAKKVVEKLTENVKSKDLGLNVSDLMQKDRLCSLYNEIKASANKLDGELQKRTEEEEDEVTKIKITDIKLKRKIEEKNTEPEKLINMTKTWNDIKSKIQEERERAEIKMKELCDSSGSESERDEKMVQVKVLPKEKTPKIVEVPEKDDLRFTNFTNDEYILTELEKTDKIFRKLKNRKVQKSASLGTRSKSPVLQKSGSLDLRKAADSELESQKKTLLEALKKMEKEKGDEEFRVSPLDEKDQLMEMFGPNQRRLDNNDNFKFEFRSLDVISATED